MMIDWLVGSGNRFRLGGRWYHWLPTFGYGIVLLAMTVGIWPRGGVLMAAFVSTTYTATLSSAGLSPYRPYLQHSVIKNDLRPGQGGVISPLTLSEAFPALPLLPEARPLVVAPVASLSFPVPSRMPETIARSEREDRKRVFIHFLLPTIRVAMDEVRQERRQLMGIIAELGENPAELVFREAQTDWQQRLGADKSKFILGLTRKYRSAKADELLDMVNVLPASLVIAQGALESSWGASRFATEVNNLFGMYSSADSKMSAGGKTPKIMEYDSILESVRAYVLNINRLPAYKEVRRIRCQTLDPLLIAEGLIQYSERKEHYINDVKHIIAGNNLQDYDTLIFSAG